MTIISKSHAEKLLRNAGASIVSGLIKDGQHYVVINNFSAVRTDHYKVTEGQFSAKMRYFDSDEDNVK